MSRDLDRCVAQSIALENERNRTFTFLTVTNAGASDLNWARVRKDFPNIDDKLDIAGVPVDPAQSPDRHVFLERMTVRLTKNLDKDRGFVNGAIGTVKRVLNKHTFVLGTADGVILLVHAVQDRLRPFVPATYGYAMTIRRAQGCTLDLVGLHFNRRKPDTGYGYVGVSRAKRRSTPSWLAVFGAVTGFPSAAMYAGLIMSKSIQVHCQRATMNMIVPQVLPIMTNLVLWVAAQLAHQRTPHGGHFFWTSRVRRSRRPHRVSLAAKMKQP